MRLTSLALAIVAATSTALALACGDDALSGATTQASDAAAPRDAVSPPEPPEQPSGDDSPAVEFCPPHEPIDAASLPYEPPAAAQVGACTEAEVAAMPSLLPPLPGYDAGDPFTASSDDLERAVSPACAACMFGDAKALTWRPILVAALRIADVDIGGCFALVTGDDACARAVQNRTDCNGIACDGCPLADAVLQLNCTRKADTAACKDSVAAEVAACSAVSSGLLAAAQQACRTYSKYPYEGPVRVSCISGVPGDAGGDGG